MSLKKTLFFALILAAALVYLYKFEFPKEEQKEAESRLLPAVKSEQLARVEIQRQGQEFALENSGGWKLQALPDAELDTSLVNSLVNGLVELKLDKKLEKDKQESDLSIYGLKEPALTVKATTAEGAPVSGTLQLDFGKKNEYVGGRYLKVQKPGAESFGLYLVNESLFAAADKDRDAFRKKTPVDFKLPDLSRIDQTGAAPAAIELDAAAPHKDYRTLSSWRVVEDRRYPASETALNELLRKLRAVKVDQFKDGADADPWKRELERPEGTLKFAYRPDLTKEPFEVRYIHKSEGDGKEKKTYFSISGKSSVFVSNGTPIADALKPAASYREEQIAKFNTTDVAKLTAQAAGQVLWIIERSPDGFQVNGNKADAPFINELLDSASQLKALSFPSVADSSNAAKWFGTPALQLTFDFASSTKSQSSSAAEGAADNQLVLTLGEPAEKDAQNNPKTLYAKLSDIDIPFVVDADALKKLKPGLEVLVPPAPSLSSSSAAAGESVSADSVK